MAASSEQFVKSVSLVKEEPTCVVYEGDYRKDKRHGNGTSTHKDGSIYAGEWRCNLRNGFGRMSHPDGSFYQGEWKNNAKHGFGMYVYPNGDQYEGQWYNGLRHGLGTYTHTQSDCSFFGTWREGQRLGPAEIRTENYRYYAIWMDAKPTGMSAFTFKCNTMVTGYMDTTNCDEKSCSTSDFNWYTKKILKYDRGKLPSEPILFSLSDSSDAESENEDSCDADDTENNAESRKLMN